MAIVQRVQIEGFWGHHRLDFALKPDVSFLTGINGSGKTTVINLIAAALTGDFATLDRMDFKSVKVTLLDKSNRRKPIVEIRKKSEDNTPFQDIEYRLRSSSADEATVYSLEEYEERLQYRNLPRRYRRVYHPHSRSIIEHLAQIVRVSWLSVHRATPVDEPERKAYESTVDRKLDELSNRLVRFFSSLAKQGVARRSG